MSTTQSGSLEVAAYSHGDGYHTTFRMARGGGLHSLMPVLDSKDREAGQKIVWMDEVGDIHLGETRERLEGFIKVDFGRLKVADRKVAYFAAISNDPFRTLPALRGLRRAYHAESLDVAAAENVFALPAFSSESVWLAVASVDYSYGSGSDRDHRRHKWMRHHEIVEANTGHGWFIPLGYASSLDEHFRGLTRYFAELQLECLWRHVPLSGGWRAHPKGHRSERARWQDDGF